MEKLKHEELIMCEGGVIFLFASRLIMKIVNNLKVSIKAVLRWSL